MTLREAYARSQQFLAWRRKVYNVGEQDRLDADALEVVLNAVRLMFPEEFFEQDHGIGSEGEWNPAGGGQAA